MVSSFKSRQSMPPLCLVLPLLFACLAGCAKPGDKNSENSGGQQAQGGDMSGLSGKLSSLNSADNYLTVADLDKFRPGQSKSDILKDVRWRGYLYSAAEYKGKAISAIIYEVASDPPHHKGGVSIWAIFLDDKFVKFVESPPSLPGDMEVVDHHGTPWSRPKSRKAGDNRFLIRAMNSEGVSIADLKKKVKSITVPPENIDPGLTAAYLLLRAMGAAPGPDAPASEKDYLRNAELRDQFNAARLNIGMTESEVEAVFKAKPLESGNVEAGLYRIYGSNESFNINPWLHFSNILLVFREGRATVISSTPAGQDWRRKLGEATMDLPKAAGAAPAGSSSDEKGPRR